MHDRSDSPEHPGAHAIETRCERSIPRRGFLKVGASLATTAALAGFTPAVLAQNAGAPNPGGKPRLVKVNHAEATDEEGNGRPETVQRMVDLAVTEFTGIGNIAEAWKSLVKPTDTVGIKINLRGGTYLAPQPCVVDAIIAGLKAAGVPENKIIVWDAWAYELKPAGFTPNSSANGVRYIGVDGTGEHDPLKLAPQQMRELYKDRYTSESFPVGDKSVQLCKLLAEEITALINVPLVKDHRVCGVTCAMKNHFGSILNPSELHGNFCDPYVPALNALAPIKEKTRLILVDGLRALYNGGPHDQPQWRWRLNAIMAGTDPVAMDTLALQILNTKRAEEGMDPIGEKAKHLATAAQMGLGVGDLAQVDLREIDAAKA